MGYDDIERQDSGAILLDHDPPRRPAQGRERLGHDRCGFQVKFGQSRRVVAIAGFLVAAAAILPATFTAHPLACVWWSCIAFFGLEITVGVSWAIPLDIGGDCHRQPAAGRPAHLLLRR